jgi:hypothetical protein
MSWGNWWLKWRWFFIASDLPTSAQYSFTAVLLQVDQLSSPVAQMEYKAFHDLPHNAAIQKLLPKE